VDTVLEIERVSVVVEEIGILIYEDISEVLCKIEYKIVLFSIIYF